MTFGTEWGWGTSRDTAFGLLDYYLESGGNFVDTADGYTNGSSERLLGEYFEARGTRDQVVLSTKYTFNTKSGDPNAGGNGRKNLYRALHGSLKRLRTDYIDVYWVHAWDGVTPVEEVVSTLDDMVRAGKVRAIGVSDAPAWYVARAHTLAEWRGSERIAGLQLEYSLVERNIEREHLPVAKELGIGVTAWSPLGSGLLTGKYRRDGAFASGDGRLLHTQRSGNPAFEKLMTEKNWTIVETLARVAENLGRSQAEVALNWVAKRPGVTSTLVGATNLAQLEANLNALNFELPTMDQIQLDEVSAPELVHPYHFFEKTMRGMINGGVRVSR
jgi:aryl-alcohol dehydrogenase-like predicted oxidoreductase